MTRSMRDGAPVLGKHVGPASRMRSAQPLIARAPSIPLSSSDMLRSPTSSAGTSPRLRSQAMASETMARLASALRAPSASPYTCTMCSALAPPA
eukprot:9312031-Lingulodinium_polyedra.AAC.1